MKKKFLVMLLAATVMTGSAMPAFAETETVEAAEETVDAEDEEADADAEDAEDTDAAETTENVINFDDIDPAYEGTWIDFEDAFSVYVPDDWSEIELTEDDQENGIFYAITASDGTGWNMNINYQEAGDETYTLEQLAELFAAEENYTGVEIDVINGMDAISFQTVDNTACIFTFMDEDGGLYTMVITGDLTNDDFVNIAVTMGGSLGVYDLEDTEEDMDDLED
ncbi:MAG: hypothetical protein Q4B26_05975 [Eubacteriales bacterium]|nr:hypothetical protein [Eubacteriales bacterium]